MNAQDVIAFPRSDSDDERDLAEAFARQRDMDERAKGIAELLYNARAAYVDGSRCLPWDLLTRGQRQGYMLEALMLIRGF